MAKNISNDWRNFGDKLMQERRDTKPSSIASKTFVKRMTSSAADPEAAQKEGEDGASSNSSTSRES